MVQLIWAGRKPGELSREFGPTDWTIRKWVRQPNAMPSVAMAGRRRANARSSDGCGVNDAAIHFLRPAIETNSRNPGPTYGRQAPVARFVGLQHQVPQQDYMAAFRQQCNGLLICDVGRYPVH